jgi:hypothetical protein
MPTNTYVALDTKTVGTAVSSVTFTSIPQGYTDLVLVFNGFSASAGSSSLRFNGDSGSNYSYTNLKGNGSTATSARGSNNTLGYIGEIYNSQTVTIINIQNYSNATTYKTTISRSNNAGNATSAWVSLWRSTAAITSLEFLSGDTLQVGSTFTIYGIAAVGASPTPKATGGAIYSDTDYWYHVFASNGTFTPSQALTADVLIVAGGGGGGGGTSAAGRGGGGGAGGYGSLTAQSLTSGTGYTCTVGAGGSTTVASNGVNGGNSTFNATTLTGGGGGASWNSGGSGFGNGSAGGSGGGAGQFYGATDTVLGGAASPSGQGYAGGSGITTGGGNFSGCGGGGAGAVGTSVTTSGSVAVYTTGGVGLSTHSSWGVATGIGQNVNGTYYIAGGGGGTESSVAGNNSTYSQGGYGGGGVGSYGATGARVAGTAGLAFTGGGGGGGGENVTAGNGGSGVVIVRYLKA